MGGNNPTQVLTEDTHVEVLTLTSGYDRRKTPETTDYRRMTAEEARKLYPGCHVPFLGLNGKVYSAKVNGAVKTWKRDTARVEVPMKYGMYECFTVGAREDGAMERLLVAVTEGN